MLQRSLDAGIINQSAGLTADSRTAFVELNLSWPSLMNPAHEIELPLFAIWIILRTKAKNR
jgi:hypothetical protein